QILRRLRTHPPKNRLVIIAACSAMWTSQQLPPPKAKSGLCLTRGDQFLLPAPQWQVWDRLVLSFPDRPYREPITAPTAILPSVPLAKSCRRVCSPPPGRAAARSSSI